MSKFPFTSSSRQLRRTLRSISEPAWVISSEIYDITKRYEMESGSEDEFLTKLHHRHGWIEDKFYQFYQAVAVCPIDKIGIHDLFILGSTIAAIDTIEDRKLIFMEIPKEHWDIVTTIANYVASLVDYVRQINDIPRDIPNLIEFAKLFVSYASSGAIPAGAIPTNANPTLVSSAKRWIMKTPQEAYPLKLKEAHVIIFHMGIIQMLNRKLVSYQEYDNRDDSIHALEHYIDMLDPYF